MKSVDVTAFGGGQGGDWMMGGSGDTKGQKLYGFGPKEAAMLAVEAYNELRDLDDGQTTRETFVYTLGYIITVKVCQRAGVPFNDREVRDMAEYQVQEQMAQGVREEAANA